VDSAHLPATFTAHRDAVHALAEHVLAAARYRVEGRIGLRPTPGGFGTPMFGAGEQVRVDGTELVSTRNAQESRAPITTLGAAAEFVGIPLGAPAEVFTPTTPADPDAPLPVDAEAGRALASWYETAVAALEQLHSDTEVQLWPEHFDLGTEVGSVDARTRATVGASPGDAVLTEPYLYVGPWDAARRTGRFAEFPWGAALAFSDLSRDDRQAHAYAWFVECIEELER
jgi:hypothetical protein